MKKQFYPRTINAGLFRTFPLFTIVGGVLIAILLLLRFIFPSAFFVLAAPFWKAGDILTVHTSTFLNTFKNTQSLAYQLDTTQKERNALLEENQTLAAKLADIEKTLSGADTKTITVVAGVLARPPVSPYDTFVVSLPLSFAPNTGTMVVGPGGMPLGTIASVNGSIAQVTLFSQKGRKTEGWVSATRTPLTLLGTGTGSFEGTLPKDTPVAVDDAVYIPGPGALFIGKVAKIKTDEATQEEHLFIRPTINPFAISTVGIVTP